MLRTFRELKVWQKSYALCLAVYQLTSRFPNDERFGLSSQMRRAAVSIPSNIAEGYVRNSPRDYLRFLAISSGSLAELETHVMLCRDLNYGDKEARRGVADNAAEVRRMLDALIRSLRAKRTGDAM
jgi:four helix bundle protein